jgi:hypothetical protein
MKIGKEDFEAIISGARDIREYTEIDPIKGVSTFFGVSTASNPDYLVRAIYEMYEKDLDRKLAVKATLPNFSCWFSSSSTSKGGVHHLNSSARVTGRLCSGPARLSNPRS